MAILKKQSLVDQIYDEIKKQIIELIIPLGSKLNVSELQDKFGVRKMKRNLKESILKTFQIYIKLLKKIMKLKQ